MVEHRWGAFTTPELILVKTTLEKERRRIWPVEEISALIAELDAELHYRQRVAETS